VQHGTLVNLDVSSTEGHWRVGLVKAMKFEVQVGGGTFCRTCHRHCGQVWNPRPGLSYAVLCAMEAGESDIPLEAPWRVQETSQPTAVFREQGMHTTHYTQRGLVHTFGCPSC
jgi:hypothetical protein